MFFLRSGYCRAELDREQDAILEGTNRGLGLQGTWQEQDHWYGGKIQQVVKMEASGSNASGASFKLTLERMQMTRSHRFARYLGSRRLLQFKIAGKDRQTSQEREFLKRNFVLCGRVFVPFSIKDNKVYLMEVDADYDTHQPSQNQGDHQRRSLEEFVTWHNPMELNSGQVS